jgi:hypothetical protein
MKLPEARRRRDGQLGAVRSTAGDRPAAQAASCPSCGKGFTKPDGTGKKGWRLVPIVIETIEVSIMRGDDEVHFWHPECWDVAHPVPGPGRKGWY